MIKRLEIFLGCCILFSGCTSLNAIKANYTKLVDLSDGVNQQEAKIIAQQDIIQMYEKQAYRISRPDIRTTSEALQYPEFWFVVFGHNWFSPMSTDSMAKTYGELKDALYVVVINKTSGVINFSGEWYFKRDASFDWVFNPQAYRRTNSLALPPYSVGHKVGKTLSD